MCVKACGWRRSQEDRLSSWSPGQVWEMTSRQASFRKWQHDISKQTRLRPHAFMKLRWQSERNEWKEGKNTQKAINPTVATSQLFALFFVCFSTNHRTMFKLIFFVSVCSSFKKCFYLYCYFPRSFPCFLPLVASWRSDLLKPVRVRAPRLPVQDRLSLWRRVQRLCRCPKEASLSRAQ